MTTKKRVSKKKITTNARAKKKTSPKKKASTKKNAVDLSKNPDKTVQAGSPDRISSVPRKKKVTAKKKRSVKKKAPVRKKATKRAVKKAPVKKRANSSKKELFVEEYLIDNNATQAAIRAGYSKRTAHSQGSRLLKNVEVAKAIAKAKAERSEKTGVDAEWLLNRLYDEVVADVADLYTESGELRPVHEWPMIWRTGLVAGLDTEEKLQVIDDDVIPGGTIMKVKLSDRLKRLDLIGKHVDVQAFLQKIEHSGKVDLAGRMNRARKRAAGND